MGAAISRSDASLGVVVRHEAAHLQVAVARSYPVRGVTIVPRGNGRFSGSVTPCPSAPRGFDALIVTLAGPISEGKELSALGAEETDRLTAEALALELCGKPGENRTKEEIIDAASRCATEALQKLHNEITAYTKNVIESHDPESKCFFDADGARVANLPEC